MNIQKAKDRYYSPTSKRMRQVGDSILIFSAGIQGSIMGLPIEDNTKAWLMFGIGVFGVAGKITTNFSKKDDTNDSDFQTAP